MLGIDALRAKHFIVPANRVRLRKLDRPQELGKWILGGIVYISTDVLDHRRADSNGDALRKRDDDRFRRLAALGCVPLDSAKGFVGKFYRGLMVLSPFRVDARCDAFSVPPPIWARRRQMANCSMRVTSEQMPSTGFRLIQARLAHLVAQILTIGVAVDREHGLGDGGERILPEPGDGEREAGERAEW